MIAPIQDPIKFDSEADAHLWLQLKGFKKVREVWIGDKTTVQVTKLPASGKISVQLGVPA